MLYSDTDHLDVTTLPQMADSLVAWVLSLPSWERGDVQTIFIKVSRHRMGHSIFYFLFFH